MTAAAPTWVICATAIAGVIARPFRWPEAVWAVAGAALLVLLGLLPVGDALSAIGKGADVYLILAGMMLLSEAARVEVCSIGWPRPRCARREARPPACSR